MKLLLARVAIISSLMISSSIALTGVGYAGAEGVGIIIIHLIYAFLIDKVIRQRNEAQRKHTTLTVALDASRNNTERALDAAKRAHVNFQLAQSRIEELETMLNTREWARRKQQEYDEHFADASRYFFSAANPSRNNSSFHRQNEHARKTLGLPAGVLTKEMVRKAYAAAVKKDHPDHGGTGEKLERLAQAKRRLMESLA